ncbi:hypothetical protein ABZ618_18295 [Streptomyces roseolus]|uniref:hypothetical protein n=1 Tax=Streptomyces roseolus TaxID=67358 RepID=UPI0033D994CC
MNLRRPSRPVRRALLATAAAGLAVLAAALWFGTPYPAADPEAAAARLKAEAQRAYDEAGLPPGTVPVHNGVETGSCSYRGLRSLAHIDRSRPDVRSFRLGWEVRGVPEAVARAGHDRTRARLAAAGWKPGSSREDSLMFGFDFAHPDSGEVVNLDWHEPTGTYAVSAYVPCGRLPDGFDAYAWPSAAWRPER